MARRVGKIRISGEFLCVALGMPKGTLIYNITRHQQIPDVFIFHIEHPNLPEIIEGAEAPYIFSEVNWGGRGL